MRSPFRGAMLALACLAARVAGAAPLQGASPPPPTDPPPATPSVEFADDSLVRLAAPILADWIVQSRDEALAEGVRPIPPAIREAVAGYVPAAILERARWRAGGGGQLSLQSNSFYFSETPAITLDYVIVFRAPEDARNVEIWVHELRHVIQFQTWGIEGFSLRYLSNGSAVESDAARYRWAWVFGSGRAVGRLPESARLGR